MLENKVVVITGSGQGIGKHAATTFAKEKAKVVIADFNAELAKKTAAELSRLTETVAHPSPTCAMKTALKKWLMR